MELILKQDIKHLGEKDDIVNVKPGYGRNYLIPQGYATLATLSAKKVLAENIKQATFKQEKIRKDADAITTKLEGIKLSIGAKAGESGKIFGAVNTIQIADALKKEGFDGFLMGEYFMKQAHPELSFQLFAEQINKTSDKSTG